MLVVGTRLRPFCTFVLCLLCFSLRLACFVVDCVVLVLVRLVASGPTAVLVGAAGDVLLYQHDYHNLCLEIAMCIPCAESGSSAAPSTLVKFAAGQFL
jgi:hypothetical protein